MLNFILFIFCILIIFSGFFVILSQNPIHSILFLVLVFLGSSGILLILGAEFLAMLFLVVYIGAIAVLFLFVVMMLNIKIIELSENLIKYIPIGGFIGFILFFEVLYLIVLNFQTFSSITDLNNSLIDVYNNLSTITNIESIGFALYTEYVYLFLLAGLILLVAMVGSIILTLNKSNLSKSQDYYTQTNRKINKSIRYLF